MSPDEIKQMREEHLSENTPRTLRRMAEAIMRLENRVTELEAALGILNDVRSDQSGACGC